MVSLQLRLCLILLQAGASLRLRDLVVVFYLLVQCCRFFLSRRAEQVNGECFRLKCAPDDEAILTTGFGVMAVSGGSRPKEDASGLWKS